MSNTKKIVALIVFALSAAIARAELVVTSGFVRASLPGVTSTSAYMTLNNNGDADIIISGVTTPVAGKVSFHSTMNHDGMMHMMGMENLKIAAHKSLVLESGGMHLMLENISGTLIEGSKVDLVLQFADGQKKAVSLPVQSVLADKH